MSSDDEYVNDISDDDAHITSTYDTRSTGPASAVVPHGTAPHRPRRGPDGRPVPTIKLAGTDGRRGQPKNGTNGSAQDRDQDQQPDTPGQKGERAAWEGVKRSWDAVLESADGSLDALAGAGGVWQLEADARRRLLRDTTPLQRGIIRHVVLVLDASFAMADKDLLPHRHNRVATLACEFVAQFFEQNPISQLGIVGMRDGVAVRISDLGGNPELHIERLREWQRQEPSGNPSLQNALEMCRGALFHAPSHGTREVLIVYGALLSSDPGNIHTTLANLVTDHIRVSIIGLSAHLAICAELCTRTNAGDSSTYNVALDEVHLRDLLLAATTPPVSRSTEHSVPSLLMMGFPPRLVVGAESKDRKPDVQPDGGPGAKGPALCACHLAPMREGYPCTRCGTQVCKLPAACPACGLTLILSTHLARSYHHLFPLRNWVDVSWAEAGASPFTSCFSCLAPFPAPPRDHSQQELASGSAAGASANGNPTGPKIVLKNKPDRTASNNHKDQADADDTRARGLVKGISESARYACVVCKSHFCIDCDVFAHEVLHNCPGCQSIRPPEENGDAPAQAATGGNDGIDGSAMVVD